MAGVAEGHFFGGRDRAQGFAVRGEQGGLAVAKVGTEETRHRAGAEIEARYGGEGDATPPVVLRGHHLDRGLVPGIHDSTLTVAIIRAGDGGRRGRRKIDVLASLSELKGEMERGEGGWGWVVVSCVWWEERASTCSNLPPKHWLVHLVVR